MVDTVPSRFGQINGAGATDALFLKVFSGEVLAAFEERTIMAQRVTTRTITSGKSAQFPAVGRASAAYHAAGEDILDNTNGLLNQFNHNEVVITIDDLLTAPTFVDSLEEAKNHYDVRSIYATELGRALAIAWDQRLIRVGVLGAQDSAALVTDVTDVGTDNINATFLAAGGASALAEMFLIAQTMDEAEVPEDDRFVALEPRSWYLLVQNQDLLNRDFGGQNGIFSDGTIRKAAGLEMLKTNQLSSQGVFVADAGEGDASTVTLTNYVALAWHRSGLGVVKLKDLAMEMEYMIQNQGHLLVAKFAFGAKHLRNYGCYAVKTV